MPPRALLGAPERRAALNVFDRALRTGNAFGYNGPFEQKYERDFAAFMGGGFADGVNSGTTAVYCALGALQLDALSTTQCVHAAGVKPALPARSPALVSMVEPGLSRLSEQ